MMYGSTFGRRRYGRFTDEEPRVRLGICCGVICKRHMKRRGKDVTLYKVAELFRYRCRECYRSETGYYP